MLGSPQARVLIRVCLVACRLYLGADQGGYLSMSPHCPPSTIPLFSTIHHANAYQQAWSCGTYAVLSSWPAIHWWDISKWNTFRRVFWDSHKDLGVQFSNCNLLCSEWQMWTLRHVAWVHLVNTLMEKCWTMAWLCTSSRRQDEAGDKGLDTCPHQEKKTRLSSLCHIT